VVIGLGSAGPGSVLPEAADELRAVGGLGLQLFHIDPALFQMPAKYLSKQTRTGSSLFVAEAGVAVGGG